MVVLVSKLAENRETETKEAASIAYAEKLKPFHGWVSSSAFSVVLQFPPARKGFVENLGRRDGVRNGRERVSGEVRAGVETYRRLSNQRGFERSVQGIKRWNHVEEVKQRA